MADSMTTQVGACVPDQSCPSWSKRASHALIEAETMSGSITAIVETLVKNADKQSFPLLEAILACTQRIDAAVAPVTDDTPAEVYRD